jgi:hypothetical protein
MGQVAQIYTNFDEYYKAYTQFEKCIETNPGFSYDSSNNYTSTSTNCNAAATALNGKYVNFKNTLEAAKTNTLTVNNTLTDVQSKHKEVERLRSSLDLQLSDIYQRQGQISGFNGQDVDATVVASVLWTILAGGLVYYIFVGRSVPSG